MATNTYVALKTTTVSGSPTTSVNFDLTGISGYTDLVIVSSTKSQGGYDYQNQLLTFNSDTGTNYSYTQLYGNGSSAASSRQSSISSIPCGYDIGTTQSGVWSVNTLHIMNYANSTTYKTVLIRKNATPSLVTSEVGLWRSTSAITYITLSRDDSNGFSVGSTFTLYGIANADVGAYATGGIITQDATYYYHAFGNSSYFVPNRNLTCDYLVIAGGGGGGTGLAAGESESGGGGGAGGLRSTVGYTGGGGTLESALSLTSGTSYTVTIGAGGAGVTSTANTNGTAGSNSTFSTITSTGGGYGGKGQTGGGSGGSGGGGGAGPSGSSGAGGGRTTNQGYAGGGGSFGATSGGGGGAGAVGGTGASYVAGVGGDGVSIPALAFPTGTGVSTYYAGGGGAGGLYTGTIGGLGGGGNGTSQYGGSAGGSGIASTGGGGGGGSVNFPTSGAGGSGLVIVRYAK